MPILLLVLITGAIAAGVAFSHHGEDEGSGAKKTTRKGPPPPLSQQLPGQSKADAVKAKIVDLQRRVNQGDKDAGKILADLKAAWGNLTKK